MAAKLTPLQLETLRLIADGEIYQKRFGYGAWRIQGGNPSSAGRLVSLGLAEWGPLLVDFRSCKLTDAGRTALSQHQGGTDG